MNSSPEASAEGATAAAADRSTRWGRLLCLVGWWALLGALLWACFLRPPPRSLAATTDWFLTTPGLVAPVAGALLGGAALVLRRRRADRLALTGVALCVAWFAAAALHAMDLDAMP